LTISSTATITFSINLSLFETLNLDFFRKLFNVFGDNLQILEFRKGNKTFGAAICMVRERTMTFALVGLHYEERDKYDVYFNLVYGILQLAFRAGVTELHLGQTSYWLKQRIGGICIPEFFLFKAMNPLVHHLLKKLNPLIFPREIVKKPTVFRMAPSHKRAEATT